MRHNTGASVRPVELQYISSTSAIISLAQVGRNSSLSWLFTGNTGSVPAHLRVSTVSPFGAWRRRFHSEHKYVSWHGGVTVLVSLHGWRSGCTGRPFTGVLRCCHCWPGPPLERLSNVSIHVSTASSSWLLRRWHCQWQAVLYHPWKFSRDNICLVFCTCS